MIHRLFFEKEGLSWLLRLSGVFQLLLALFSLAIPKVLRWSEDTRKLRTLTRQVFWTYASYLWYTHICMGLLSLFAPHWLLAPWPLSQAINGYIAAYWGVRFCIQWLYFDRSQAPPGIFYQLSEIALVSLFAFFTLVYGLIFVLPFLQRT